MVIFTHPSYLMFDTMSAMSMFMLMVMMLCRRLYFLFSFHFFSSFFLYFFRLWNGNIVGTGRIRSTCWRSVQLLSSSSLEGDRQTDRTEMSWRTTARTHIRKRYTQKETDDSSHE